MVRRRNRTGISLRGFRFGTNRITLKGYESFEKMMMNTVFQEGSYGQSYSNIIHNITNVTNLPGDYMDLKLYLINKFLIPLSERKFDYVNQNYYNIDWVLEELDKLDYPELEEEIEFFRRVIEVLQFAATTQLTFDDLKAKLYGKRFGITVETSRIILQAPYEVYVILFGNPKDNTDKTFDEEKINDIKDVLGEKPGIMLDEIRDKLAIKYYKYYTKYHKEKIQNLHPDWELEETENDQDLERNYKKRIDKFLEDKEKKREEDQRAMMEHDEDEEHDDEEEKNVKLNIDEDDDDHSHDHH
jgi:hypothetical protein